MSGVSCCPLVKRDETRERTVARKRERTLKEELPNWGRDNDKHSGRLPPVSSHLAMSRHPSPGPSHSAPHIPPQPSAAPSRRSRPSHSIGIAAGAEDVKYQGKYKDLKRKVKEIEGVSHTSVFVHALC